MVEHDLRLHSRSFGLLFELCASHGCAAESVISASLRSFVWMVWGGAGWYWVVCGSFGSVVAVSRVLCVVRA